MGNKRSELTCEDTGGAGVDAVCTIEEAFYQIDQSMKKNSRLNNMEAFFLRNQDDYKDITSGKNIG